MQDVLTTSRASAQAACDFIGAGSPAPSLSAMRSADVWLIATTDAQIATATADIKGKTEIEAVIAYLQVLGTLVK